MKILISSLMAIFVLLATLLINPHPSYAASERALVVYFSCTGSTKSVAEQIAEKIGGDLFEIVPSKPYSDADLNYNNDNSRSNLEMKDPKARPAIANKLPNLDAYNLIYIGYPIWWGTMPRIINTFLESYNFAGKTIRPFCTSGGSGVSKSVDDIKMALPKATVKQGLEISSYSVKTSQEIIANWLKQDN